ncbi:MAG: hypothetical protein JRG91_06735 [Deltaproteobacteria bacterium]|nr:hypothetical protein [Deltaproteobacteria bacterium]
MGKHASILVLAAVLLPLHACTDTHDPVRDGVDDSTDALLDADGLDALQDPDPEDDCPATAPFESACPGDVTCPDRGDLPSTCNVDLIQFRDPVIGGGFSYVDHGVTDACASVCECAGFIKMQVDAGSEHVVEGGEFSTPAVSYDMGGSTNPFTISTRIINSFGSDGQSAGLYVLQDSENVLTVTLDRSSGGSEIFTQLDMPAGGGYMHSDSIPGSETDVDLSIQRTDETSWNIIVNGTSIPVSHSFSLTVHEVGIAMGNFSSTPLTAVLYDYICINEP